MCSVMSSTRLAMSRPRDGQPLPFCSPQGGGGGTANCPVRGWLVTALLPPPWRAPPGVRSAAPALVEYVGTL